MTSIALITLLAVAQAASTPAPITGWTQGEVIAAFQAAGLTGVEDNTVDPNFPDIQARFLDRFQVSAVRMACSTAPPTPEANCAGVWLTVAMPSTETRWAQKIVASLERRGTPPLAVNAFLHPITTPDWEYGPIVMLDQYVIANGGVHHNLLSEHLSTLLGFVDQTEDFMIRDDPRHIDLWDGSSAER